MKPIWQILQPSQLGTTLDDVKSALGGFTTKMALDLQRILSNGATFKDNLATAYIEFDAIHGTEMPIANPFRSVPQAFIPISAFTLVGGVGGRNNGVQLAIAGQPILNLSRTDSFLGITVQYAPPRETVNANVSRAAFVAPVTATPINVASLTLAAGEWLLSGSISWNIGANNWTITTSAISKTSATLPSINTTSDPTSGEIRIVQSQSASAPGGDWTVPIPPYRVALTASTPLFLVAQSTFTGGIAQAAWGYIEAQRLAPDPATTARVRGILVEA